MKIQLPINEGMAKLIPHKNNETVTIIEVGILKAVKTNKAEASRTNNFPKAIEGNRVVRKNINAIPCKIIHELWGVKKASKRSKYWT